ncbi:MAG: CocE/NonD family hydrolase [Deltaproteobacteria bacterium]|nr:CocE/NonD family hydrolase [Deltaproteobacteria bacterium]
MQRSSRRRAAWWGRLRALATRAALLALALAALTSTACRLEAQPISIPMRDGKSLAADLYLPLGVGPWPTILLVTPYDKDPYRLRLPFAAESYAWVIVDARGLFGSVGAANPDAAPGEDGYDCVEWIARQTWSDSHVGMWGPSALGVVQFQTAREHPPHLDAGVPLVASFATSYANYYPGGAMRLEYVASLSLADTPGIGAQVVLAHPAEDSLWGQVEAQTQYGDELGVPMLVVGGWYDHRTEDLLASYRDLVTRGLGHARAEHRLLIGPWEHDHVDEESVGALTFPNAAGVAAEASLAFFDKHLRGIEGGPSGGRARWFDTGLGEWRDGDEFPPAGGAAATFHLGAGGVLTPAAPTAASSSSPLRYDPNDPSPTIGGANFSGTVAAGPQDQAAVEARNDALVFTSAPLAADLRVAGTSRAVIFGASNRTDTDLVVRLTDVHPDGTSMLVTDGARKGRFASGTAPEDEALLAPGTVYSFAIDLPSIAITFRAGHRVRVVVTSSNYPRFYANRNDGGVLYDPDAPYKLANNTVFHDSKHLSRLILPLAP